MPVTNSSKWNRLPEDFEEFYGAEMQPFLAPFILEEEERLEEEYPQIPEIEAIDENMESVVPAKNPFLTWLKGIAGKVKNTTTKFQLRA